MSASKVVQSTSAGFPATRWSLVLQARDVASRDAAMEEICREYWYPIYAFLRKSGHQPADAEDLTQSFFLHILSDHSLERAHAERGRLRSFLLANLKHHLQAQRIQSQAIKRGSGQSLLPLDGAHAEQRYAEDFIHPTENPEQSFAKIGAAELFRRVMNRLAERFPSKEKTQLFESLRDSLLGGAEAHSYSRLAIKLQIPENTLRSHVRRFRQSFRQELEAEIAQTVDTSEEIRAELKYLGSLLTQSSAHDGRPH